MVRTGLRRSTISNVSIGPSHTNTLGTFWRTLFAKRKHTMISLHLTEEEVIEVANSAVFTAYCALEDEDEEA